jgi:hypothetical protein
VIGDILSSRAQDLHFITSKWSLRLAVSVPAWQPRAQELHLVDHLLGRSTGDQPQEPAHLVADRKGVTANYDAGV